MVGADEGLMAHVGDPEFMAAYRDWLKNPVTQRMIKLAERTARPSPLSPVTGKQALYQQGLVVAAAAQLELFTSLDALRQAAERAARGEPSANYGYLRQLQDWGYDVSELIKKDAGQPGNPG